MAQAIFREMREDEGRELYRLAKKSFSPMEALAASVPRNALVAEVEGEIVGAMLLKIYRGRGGRKLGYLDLGFVVPAWQGQGIGKALYPAAIAWLREAGCEVVSAMVKDDNVASWGLLARQGFGIVGYGAFLRRFGLRDGLLMAMRTWFFVACGMNFWTDAPPPKQSGTLREILAAFLLMLGFQCARQVLRFLQGQALRAEELAVGALVMGICILAGWLGTLMTKGKWHFQVPRGGFAISFVLMLFGTYFPLLGHWYPETWAQDARGRRRLAVVALVEWAVLLFLYASAKGTWLAARGLLAVQMTAQYAAILLFFHLLPIYPFEHFGGRRLWNWSKPVFLLMALLTIGMFMLMSGAYIP